MKLFSCDRRMHTTIATSGDYLKRSYHNFNRFIESCS